MFEVKNVPQCDCTENGCICEGPADLYDMGYTTCSCCQAHCPDVHPNAKSILERTVKQ